MGSNPTKGSSVFLSLEGKSAVLGAVEVLDLPSFVLMPRRVAHATA